MLFDLILKDSTVLFLDKFYIPLDYFDRKVIFYDFKQFSSKLFVQYLWPTKNCRLLWAIKSLISDISLQAYGSPAGSRSAPWNEGCGAPVSYTHLDLYKRQMQERGASPKMGRSRYSAQRLNSRYFSLPSFPTPVISPAPSVCRYRDGRAAQLAPVKMLMKQAIIFSIFFPISDNL